MHSIYARAIHACIDTSDIQVYVANRSLQVPQSEPQVRPAPNVVCMHRNQKLLPYIPTYRYIQYTSLPPYAIKYKQENLKSNL